MSRSRIYRYTHWRPDPSEDGQGFLIRGERGAVFAQIYGPHADGTYSWTVMVGSTLSGAGEAPHIRAAKDSVRRTLDRAYALLRRAVGIHQAEGGYRRYRLDHSPTAAP